LLICEREWCDLIFYHPELPALTIRQEPDTAMQTAIRQAVGPLLEERDRVLLALRNQAAPGTPLPEPVPDVDLTDSASVF
jgi:hypothetical protein